MRSYESPGQPFGKLQLNQTSFFMPPMECGSKFFMDVIVVLSHRQPRPTGSRLVSLDTDRRSNKGDRVSPTFNSLLYQTFLPFLPLL
jgi:hypothetical protein